MKLNREVILILAFLFFALATVGWDFNETATHSNGCKMPVKALGIVSSSTTHFTYINDSQVNNPKLTDRFTVGSTSYSLGDFLIYIGEYGFAASFAFYILCLILELINQRKRNILHNKSEETSIKG
jgi:hypothetical protein